MFFGAMIFGALKLFVAGVGHDPQVDESAEIVSATWSLVGMCIRCKVARLRNPQTNDGLWMWLPGWSMERFEREYPQLAKEGGYE